MERDLVEENDDLHATHAPRGICPTKRGTRVASTEFGTQAGQKEPPAYLFALGKRGMPEKVTVTHGGKETTYRFVTLFKHDFFAATGLYVDVAAGGVGGVGGEGSAVLKIQRTYHLFGLPMAWLGRRVARHEIEILVALQGVPGIPQYLGNYEGSGLLHGFVPGGPLEASKPVTPQFFEELASLLQAIHRRHVAYVDTNKRENILFGDDGRPWLIDFQISYMTRRGAKANWFSKRMLRRLQQADWYHFYKHKTRLLPEACSAEDFARAKGRGFLHNLHRWIARPLIYVRRRFLARYKLEKVK